MLGLVIYYVGTFIGGVVLATLDWLMDLDFDWEHSASLSFIALPFGIATSFLFYYILKKQWEKKFVLVEDEIQDIGKPID